MQPNQQKDKRSSEPSQFSALFYIHKRCMPVPVCLLTDQNKMNYVNIL